MTGQVAGIGMRWRAIKPNVKWGLGVLVVLGLFSAIIGRVDHVISRWPTPTQQAISPTHCAEFIALAKAKYGTAWKARLDPRDTTCLTEVQEEWERQSIPRPQPVDPTRSTASQQALPIIDDPSTLASSSPRAETFCLNVISLAKAKYGADWRAKIDPADGKACDGQISATAP